MKKSLSISEIQKEEGYMFQEIHETNQGFLLVPGESVCETLHFLISRLATVGKGNLTCSAVAYQYCFDETDQVLFPSFIRSTTSDVYFGELCRINDAGIKYEVFRIASEPKFGTQVFVCRNGSEEVDESGYVKVYDEQLRGDSWENGKSYSRVFPVSDAWKTLQQTCQRMYEAFEAETEAERQEYDLRKATWRTELTNWLAAPDEQKFSPDDAPASSENPSFTVMFNDNYAIIKHYRQDHIYCYDILYEEYEVQLAKFLLQEIMAGRCEYDDNDSGRQMLKKNKDEYAGTLYWYDSSFYD